MRIGVLSDTHGNLAKAREAIKEMGTIDALIHAGDHYMDGVSLSSELGLPVYGVIGNNDYKEQGSAELEISFLNKKFLILHGHQFGYIQSRMDKLYYTALEKDAKVVIFGHTHVPYCQWHNDILIFNPGSIYRPRSEKGATFGQIIIEGDNIFPKIFQLKKQ